MIELVARQNLSNLRRLDTQTLHGLLEGKEVDPEFSKLIKHVLEGRRVKGRGDEKRA